MSASENSPNTITEVDNIWIPLPDGTRLAARMWLPLTAEVEPVPAVLEYIPYRKRDFTVGRDEPMHSYFARHGFAAVRVDMRGSGDSDGILLDEYLEQELLDGKHVIAWLAEQPWCNGAVGMMGNSWGGFNALQVASLRPPALKAIITSCSTDNRYRDDMHYIGGCLLNDNMDWGTTFFSLLPRAPDPMLSGENWRSLWRERLEGLVQPIETWLAHPSYDDYWRHGSISEDYRSIQCAVLAVGGWLDGYSNAIPRMLSNLRCPRLGIIGPWAHMYPHQAVPGPGIGFLQEAVRWWRHWLKGEETGIMNEPMLRAFRGRATPARPFYSIAPGEWIAETKWPSEHVSPSRWLLGRGQLSQENRSADVLTWKSPQINGLAAGEWCPYGTGGRGPEFPGDQREDDGRSLVFDTAPLASELEILGAAAVSLEISTDQPIAFVVARLCEVAVDGASTRVGYGVLNLCHRSGYDRPEQLVPGNRYKVTVELSDAAYVFGKGNQIRLALSTTYWPMVWPSPAPVTLTLYCTDSHLTLPVRKPQKTENLIFDAPETGVPAQIEELRPSNWEQSLTRDLRTGLTVFSATRDEGLRRIESNGLEIATIMTERLSIQDDDPLSAQTTMTRVYEIGRGDWRTRIEAKSHLSCTDLALCLTSEVKAFEGDSLVFERRWEREYPRNYI